jgi:molybdenum cofactor guanylyltransferase
VTMIRPPGFILAGGRSNRMGGGDKGLFLLDGQPLLAHVIACIAPQTSAMAINGNGNAGRFRHLGLPVVPDTIAGFLGPLAGILAGLTWANEFQPGASHILTVPCDTPFLPRDLVKWLSQDLARTGAEIAIARDAGTIHPVIGLWPLALAGRLADALSQDGIRSVHHWLQSCRICQTAFSTEHFRNINTPADLAAAQDIPLKRAG